MIENITYLSEALPIMGRASDLMGRFNRSLLDSLKYLFSAVDEVISPPLLLRAMEKLNSLSPNKKISGFLNVLHADLISAVQNEDIKRIEIITHKIATSQLTVEDIEYINIDSLDDYYSPLVTNICGQGIPEKVEYYSLSATEFEYMKETTQKGFKLIETVCPDFFEESQSLIGEVLFLKAERLRHGSSINSFGMIYRNYFFRWEHITDTLDILIHEQAHLYLFLLNNDDPIVLNATELHDSPLRADKRPLIGIYHAAFVLSRVIYVLWKALSLGAIPNEETEYCKELVKGHIDRFNRAMYVLNSHAKLSPLGQALLTSASKLIVDAYAASCEGAVMPRAAR